MSTDAPAIFYVSNRYFLFPTLASIYQLLKTTRRAQYQLYLFLVDVSQEDFSLLTRNLEKVGVIVLPLPCDKFSFNGSIDFSRSRIPPVALGRFGVGDMIPKKHSKLIYLDGDVLPLSDISSFIRMEINKGIVYSVSEHLWLTKSLVGKFWKEHREYLGHLGIKDPKEYFNAGVFMVDRETWVKGGVRCLEYFNRNNKDYLYVDQSALNHVFYGKRKSLSPLYNYTAEYAMLARPQDTGAKIVHFTGAIKPWECEFGPWGEEFSRIYRQITDDHPWIAMYLNPLPDEKKRALARAFRHREQRSRLFFWRRLLRRYRFKKYLEEFGDKVGLERLSSQPNRSRSGS